jgi:hypothetical protein
MIGNTHIRTLAIFLSFVRRQLSSSAGCSHTQLLLSVTARPPPQQPPQQPPPQQLAKLALLVLLVLLLVLVLLVLLVLLHQSPPAREQPVVRVTVATRRLLTWSSQTAPPP